MKKIIICLLLILGSLVIVSSPAHADGCGPTDHLSTAVSSGNDNLLVPGRPILFKLHVDKRDCDGYDLVTGMYGTVHKDNGNCKNIWATTTDYRLDPNIISGTNPPELGIPCDGGLTGGTTDYIVFWNVYEKITSGMTENNRCVGMYVTVADRLQKDPHYTTPSLCFNGL